MNQVTMRVTFEVDVSAVAPAGVRHLRGDIFVPHGERPDVLILCVPGGGMSRAYFHLDVPVEQGNFSMAHHLAASGYAVVLLDHPGVGESDTPDDGFTLTPECVADVEAYAFEHIYEGLRTGKLNSAVDPLPLRASIGLGHSAGGLLTVYRQGRHRSHTALALLGYAGGGLPSHLSEREKSYLHDPAAVQRDIVDLAKERQAEALPAMRRGSSDFLVGKPMAPDVHAALVAARAPLLALVGLTSMITGASRHMLDAIDVPVFLCLGDRDIAGATHVVPSQFPSCHDVTLYVLEDAGHNHNVADTRELLWSRVVRWIKQVV